MSVFCNSSASNVTIKLYKISKMSQSGSCRKSHSGREWTVVSRVYEDSSTGETRSRGLMHQRLLVDWKVQILGRPWFLLYIKSKYHSFLALVSMETKIECKAQTRAKVPSIGCNKCTRVPRFNSYSPSHRTERQWPSCGLFSLDFSASHSGYWKLFSVCRGNVTWIAPVSCLNTLGQEMFPSPGPHSSLGH